MFARTDTPPAALPAMDWAQSCGSRRLRDIYSVPGKGTAVIARWPLARRIAAAQAACTCGSAPSMSAKPGQEVCGDSWGACSVMGTRPCWWRTDSGHGYEASMASHGSRAHACASIRSWRREQLLEHGAPALCAARAARRWRWRASTGRGQIDVSRGWAISRRRFIPAPNRASIWFRSTARPAIKRSGFANSVIPGRTTACLVLHSDGLSRRPAWKLIPAWRCAIRA